jgi:hypothetical protein
MEHEHVHWDDEQQLIIVIIECDPKRTDTEEVIGEYEILYKEHSGVDLLAISSEGNCGVIYWGRSRRHVILFKVRDVYQPLLPIWSGGVRQLAEYVFLK